METPKNLLQNQPKPQLPAQKKEVTKINESNKVGVGKILVAFLLGAIVGAFGFWVSSDKEVNEVKEENKNVVVSEENKEKNEDTETAPNKTSDRKEPVSVSGSNAISANNQSAGDRAEIDMVTLSVAGWVAIHEDRNGGLGNILGAQRYESGIHLGEVRLLRPMISGAKYHAVLYQDFGDRGFNSSEDAPIKNAEGKIIESIFETN